MGTKYWGRCGEKRDRKRKWRCKKLPEKELRGELGKTYDEYTA
jgi:hypothetical protein